MSKYDNNDFKTLFEAKQAEFDQLQLDYQDFKGIMLIKQMLKKLSLTEETSKMFEEELEQENQNLLKKTETLQFENDRIKEDQKAFKVLFFKKFC